MKKVLKYLLLIVFAGSFSAGLTAAAEKDDGTDSNGKFILSSVLAQRCGISSTAPDITEDCVKRLAYDRQTDNPIDFENFEAERKAIIGDYAAAYLYQAVVGMTASGKYEDKIDELIGEDPSLNISLDNDAREDLEKNNKLASSHASAFLDAVNMRASAINLENVKNILDVLVPATIVDDKDTSLAETP